MHHADVGYAAILQLSLYEDRKPLAAQPACAVDNPLEVYSVAREAACAISFERLVARSPVHHALVVTVVADDDRF